MTSGLATVGQLLDWLTSFPRDTEVRIAHQPLWPFEYEIRGVVGSGELPGDGNNQKEVVWIVEGQMLAPISDEVWRLAVKKSGA